MITNMMKIYFNDLNTDYICKHIKSIMKVQEHFHINGNNMFYIKNNSFTDITDLTIPCITSGLLKKYGQLTSLFRTVQNTATCPPWQHATNPQKSS